MAQTFSLDDLHALVFLRPRELFDQYVPHVILFSKCCLNIFCFIRNNKRLGGNRTISQWIYLQPVKTYLVMK
jgi:hypothetical protein